MTAENLDRDASTEKITRNGYVLIALWVAGLMVFYGLIAYFGVNRLREYRAWALIKGEKSVGTSMSEPVAAGAVPVDVRVGVYINRIGDVSTKGSSWTADFDIWFRWRGDTVRPGEHFRVVNGDIESKEKRESFTQGDERYERYRVRARVITYFDVSRSPFDNQGLNVQIEDGVDGAEKLRYVPDDGGIAIDAAAISPGWTMEKVIGLVMLHRDPSRFGDPRLSGESPVVRSRFVISMSGRPTGWQIYVSLFKAVFVSVAIALVVFFIKPIHVDPRFGLGVGAFFAAVGNNAYIASLLPISHVFTLVDMINAVGLWTIFLTIVESTVSLYVFDSWGRERLSRVLDRCCFVAFVVGYVVVNILLPWAART